MRREIIPVMVSTTGAGCFCFFAVCAIVLHLL